MLQKEDSEPSSSAMTSAQSPTTATTPPITASNDLQMSQSSPSFSLSTPQASVVLPSQFTSLVDSGCEQGHVSSGSGCYSPPPPPPRRSLAASPPVRQVSSCPLPMFPHLRNVVDHDRHWQRPHLSVPSLKLQPRETSGTGTDSNVDILPLSFQ